MDNNFSKGSAWAIIPGQYEILAKNFRSMQANPEIMKEAAKYNSKTGKMELNIVDGVAVIDVQGSISNRMSFFSFLYGGTTVPKIKRELEDAVKSYAAKSILLNIDSPGGTVPGIDDLSHYIRSIKKPVVTYTGGMMCSASIWFGSAADRIVAGKTAELGSIGILMVHEEYSKMDKEIGINTTILKSGKYKAVGNPYEPLSKDDKNTIQAELDYLYSIFVETMAGNKGLSVDQVLPMADGKIFIGQQAVDIGLADSLGTYDDAFQEALSMGKSEVQYFFKTGKTPERKELMADAKIDSIKELKAAFPDLTAKLVQEGVDSVDIETAVKAETDRILGLAAVQFSENGDKFKALTESGVSVDQLKAIKAMEPETPEESGTPEEPETDPKAAEMLRELKKANAQDPGQGEGGDNEPKTFEAAWKAIKKEDDCDTRAAMSKAARKYPKLYDAQAKGRK